VWVFLADGPAVSITERDLNDSFRETFIDEDL